MTENPASLYILEQWVIFMNKENKRKNKRAKKLLKGIFSGVTLGMSKHV